MPTPVPAPLSPEYQGLQALTDVYRKIIVNHQPSAARIGGFITLATALVVALSLYFGASSFSKDTTSYMLFFDQSVNGLEVGSRSNTAACRLVM